MRKRIVAGNWKMNCSLEEGKKLASDVVNEVESEVHFIMFCDRYTEKRRKLFDTIQDIVPSFNHMTVY